MYSFTERIWCLGSNWWMARPPARCSRGPCTYEKDRGFVVGAGKVLGGFERNEQAGALAVFDDAGHPEIVVQEVERLARPSRGSPWRTSRPPACRRGGERPPS